MKKLLAVLLSVLMLCAMLPLGAVGVSAAGTTGACTWKLVDGHLTISGSGAMANYNRLDPYGTASPWYSDRNITSVTIEEGVTHIGTESFQYCTSIKSISLPDSLISIGDDAFYNCFGFTEITIPDNVTTIGNTVFQKCTGLISVTLGKSVTTIGKQAFDYCKKLTSINIPASVRTIGSAAFNDCIGMQEVHITDVSAWCNIDFVSGYSNPISCQSLKYPDTPAALYLNGSILTDLVIPDDITVIKPSAFNANRHLKTVIIPDGVTVIGDDAFRDCSSLTTVTIPASVTEIQDYAFHSRSNAYSLKTIYYGGPEYRWKSICSGASIFISAPSDPRHTMYYNCINPKDNYLKPVAHSVMDTENGNGLAFRFELMADGVGVKNRCEADLTNATVNYLGTDCKLVKMGAVLTNAAESAADLTLAKVNGETVLDVPAVYLQELNDDSCAFAVRIINIPDTQLERTIYARPYYIVEVDGKEVTVYSDIDAASCAEYM